jgi:hypothetical protein
MNYSNNGKGSVSANSMVTLLEKPIQPIDEFDSPKFEGSDASLPYMQMLNHPDANKAGFFITLENAEAVKFQPSAAWQLHTTTFQSGETATGYRSLTASLLVLRQSELMMFDRDSGDFIDVFQKSQYDRNIMVLKTRYLVFLVDANQKLLHQQPLLFTTKGALCGDFGEVYQKFRREMSRAFGQARNTHKPRGDRFMALAVMALRVQPVLKGKEKKSWVCAIADVNHPTADDWLTHFIGYDEATKLKVYAAFDDWADFGKPERELETQARRQAETATDASASFGAAAYDSVDDEVIEF